jgi:hypothetical protein
MPPQELFKIVGCRICLPTNMHISIEQSVSDKIVYRLAWKHTKSASQMPETKHRVPPNERI